jgi:hypothetical protein
VDIQTDQQLLRDSAGSHSEAAVAGLVRRHIDLVHSTARRMAGDSHPVEDVTQSVFVALAQGAPQLTRHPVLSGWRHRTTQNFAANARGPGLQGLGWLAADCRLEISDFTKGATVAGRDGQRTV